jgi:spiro-SPASM protein
MAKEMGSIAVVNGIGLSPLAGQPLLGGQPLLAGRSALERSCELVRGLPGVERVVLLADEDLPATLPIPAGCVAVRRGRWTVADLLAALQEQARGVEQLVYVYGDCPLLDAGLARRMLENHRAYFADYTFADGYPYGLAPEIVQAAVLPALASLAGEGREEVGRGTLFELVQKDINAFDLETEISPVDMRLLRVSLTADTRRNVLLLSRVIEQGGRDAESICRLLQQKGEILRTLPAYFDVQIVAGGPQTCLSSPWPGGEKRGEMPVERFERLAGDIERFCGDAVVGFSWGGEAAWHSDFPAIAASVLRRPGLRLIVETSGLGWKEETFAAVREAAGPRAPEWIVLLDAWSPEVYRRVRGEGFEEAKATVEKLLAHFPGRVYVQAVRMQENEEDLESFYQEWKKSAARVIVQKYDSFCGRLPDRKVADLSPLKRFPCWHLKRDLTVRLDGGVPLCREDLDGAFPLGNLFADGLPAVWQAQERHYLDHLREEYPGPCRSCDEYYTFNF